MRRQHLRDTTDLGADHVQSAAGGLDNDGAKGLGERRVEVDVAADHDVADIFVEHRGRASQRGPEARFAQSSAPGQWLWDRSPQ